MTWIVEHASGEVTQHVDRPGTAGIATGRRFMQTPHELDLTLESWDWTKGQIAVRIDVWRTRLIAQVDTQREAARRPYMTQLLGQSFVYGEKSREAFDYRNLVGSLLATLTMPQLRTRFPFAAADMDARGEKSIGPAIARFENGLTTARNELARIDGLATRAKAAIRAATTLDQMQAAAAVQWS